MVKGRITMKIVVCVTLLLEFHAAAAGMHSLRYFYTATSGMPDLPEFVDVGMVDDQVISYYDSITQRKVPRQDWMKENFNQQYWDSSTQNMNGHMKAYTDSLQIARQRFNHTTGAHTYQLMYGCEWDEETGVTEGFKQFGYDGDDFLVFNLERMSWIAPVQQAVRSKQKWDHNPKDMERDKNYLTTECVEWLKTYVDYGNSTLNRTDHPSVSLLQKSPSSPVTCHATGFYPRGVMVFWRRDGEEVFEDVDLGETLPNQDGTYQARSTLSVSAEELETHDYTCVVQHSGDKHHDIILNVADLKNKDPGSGLSPGLIAGIIIGVVVLLALVGVGLLVWKNRTRKPDEPSFSRANTDDDSNASSDAAIKT